MSLSLNATSDLVSRLGRFLAQENADAARRAVATIRKSVKILATHPQIGRAFAEMPSPFREWPISFGASGYIVLYRLTDTAVIIAAVRHGRELGY